VTRPRTIGVTVVYYYYVGRNKHFPTAAAP